MAETSNFRSMSAEVVKRFLQTVVVVDDEASFAPPDKVPKEGAKTPTESQPFSEDADDDEGEQDDPLPKRNDAAHNLDAKEVIDAFAQHGLVCSILRPETEEEVEFDQDQDTLLGRVMLVTRRSDLVVLDWDIGADEGETAKQIIKTIAEQDAGSRQKRLRLIAVYTGDGDLDVIASAVADVLKPTSKEEEGLALQRDSVRVVVYAKEQAFNIGSHNEHRRVTFRELPERLIADFAGMAEGLVSNVAIESLSVLRDNTYSILTRLHPDLDAPYLTHRLLLSQPDDAPDFLVSLIASELRGVLDEYDVGKYASGDAIEAWVNDRHGEEAHFELGTPPLSGTEMKQWLLKGSVPTRDDGEIKNLRKKHDELTAKLSKKDSSQAAALDLEFAALTSLRSRHEGSDEAPMLTLGTIVQDITGSVETSPKYWLCIQPRCDSVRLGEGPHLFPFLPYKEVRESEGKKSFDLVVRNSEDEFARLKLIIQPSQCYMVPFIRSAEDTDVIRATKQNGGFVFEGGDSGTAKRPRFKWIADLKREQAQRDISGFASYISRVGLDEFEWLRRSAK